MGSRNSVVKEKAYARDLHTLVACLPGVYAARAPKKKMEMKSKHTSSKNGLKLALSSSLVYLRSSEIIIAAIRALGFNWLISLDPIPYRSVCWSRSE